MAYTAISFVYGEVLTAAKMNILAANDASFHDGSGLPAITATMLADNAVTTAKINNGAVTTAKIVNEAVTTAKIVNEAVTAQKIDFSTLPVVENVTTDTTSLSTSLREVVKITIPRSGKYLVLATYLPNMLNNAGILEAVLAKNDVGVDSPSQLNSVNGIWTFGIESHIALMDCNANDVVALRSRYTVAGKSAQIQSGARIQAIMVAP